MLSKLLLDFHREHISTGFKSNVKYIYSLAVSTSWNYTYVYPIGDHWVAFVPSRCKIPTDFLESAYTLGNLYFGSYYLLAFEQVNYYNLGSETLVLTPDYMTFQRLPEPFLIYLLL